MNTNKNSRVVNGFMIDKHVPLPSRHHSARYPWADMGDGDSFTMGIKNGKDGKKLVKSIRHCGNAFLKRHQDTHGGLHVIVRKRQDGYDGYRVWLVKKKTPYTMRTHIKRMKP